MKLGIMQPYFLPYIGYWQLLNAVDTYVIYDDVNFIKGGWINRNNILMNGEAKMFNIQMQGASSNKLINEIGISRNNIWKKKLLKTIENCYRNAPYFEKVYPIIQSIINYSDENLARYIENSIRSICEYLCINTKIIISSEIKKNNSLKAEEKVIDICKILNADEYYNAIGGRELYSYENFENNSINLKFLKTNNNITYNQFTNKFIPNLSILDVMMFNSVSDIKRFLRHYELFEK